MYKRGTEVFNSEENFHVWMDTKSIPLGGVKPRDLLDTTYGINMVANEITFGYYKRRMEFHYKSNAQGF